MDNQIIAVYCICDDMLKALRHKEDPQCHMSDAEMMTAAIVSVLYFNGNYVRARELLAEQEYVPRMLSASRF
jgi:hypothetical protein